MKNLFSIFLALSFCSITAQAMENQEPKKEITVRFISEKPAYTQLRRGLSLYRVICFMGTNGMETSKKIEDASEIEFLLTFNGDSVEYHFRGLDITDDGQGKFIADTSCVKKIASQCQNLIEIRLYSAGRPDWASSAQNPFRRFHAR